MFVGHFCPPGSGSGSGVPIESGYGSGSTAGLEYEELPMARFPGEMKGPRCELMLSSGAAVLKKGDAAGGAQLRGRRQTEPRRLHQL